MESDEILDGEDTPTPRKIRAKRPRIIAGGDSYGLVAAPKRLKRPSDQRSVLVPSPSTNRCCIFCGLPGDVRECEGRLVGPFRITRRDGTPGKTFYAHRNCAMWGPEAYIASGGRLQQIDAVFARSKKKKCCLCGGLGASLACMFKNSACCRPMHFRCALLGGGSLRVGFNTFCPKHAKMNRSGKGPPPPIEEYIDNTPVPEQLLLPGTGCGLCEGDTYDADRGAVLTCAICYSREHSKCVFPNLERDVTFAALSWKGKYHCKRCMRCVVCEEAVDKDVYNISDVPFQQDEDDEPQCNTVKCVSCKHSAIHVACLPQGDMPHHWRCDMCRICRHCNVINIPHEKWNERYEACPECLKEIRSGGVVCPVCIKVYREGENLPMVQCDYCDKWIHADVCGGISTKKFKEMGKSEAKYRCPICTEEKKRRAAERRRSKEAGKRERYDGYGEPFGVSRADLEAILKLMPVAEDGVAFHSVRKAATQGDSLNQVFRDLSLKTEICRHCGSSGREPDLLFCADCGEGYHEFCNVARSDSPIAGWKRRVPLTQREGKLPVKRKIGGLGPGAKPWRCFQCESFGNIPNGTEVQDAIAIASCNGSVQENGLLHDSKRGAHVIRHGYEGSTVDIPTQNGRHSAVGKKAEHHSREPYYDPIYWKDERCCEFCGQAENHSLPEGRLIPWASSTVADMSNSWVHVGCAMWSNGVSLHGVDEHHDILLGARRYLLARARRTQCMCCMKTGASLICSEPNCESAYHFSCAREVGVSCLVTSSSESLLGSLRNSSQGGGTPLNIRDMYCLRILCPSHKMQGDKGSSEIPSISDMQKLFNVQRDIRILDRQGFSPDAEPPRKKGLSADRLLSLRIGSLSVLRFGQLVPEVNDFIVNGCLVPLGYCAARRFWSVARPGHRCVYFLEVCGHAQSGPLFVIRCSDAPSWRVESKDPDQAWAVVVTSVRQSRHSAGITDSSLHAIRTTGLEAFGLSNCVPVVTHIESLPMASMFSGRYLHKRVVTHRNNDIIFYNTLANKYKPVSVKGNDTGCARSQGYLPKFWIQKRRERLMSQNVEYENARSGAAFQLQVAREIFTKLEKSHAKPGEKTRVNPQSKTISLHMSGSRNAKTKAAPNQPFVTEHKGIAGSSKTRTVILRSDIDGWGVFATRDIPAGEMIIEYVGELIRPSVSDLREKRYCDKGIGCYMFEIVPGQIVDATMCGNAARYINHSCAPNCFSKTVCLESNRRVVVIFAKRRIQRGEELSYDYLFPFDDSDRVKCECGAVQCKGFMN